MLVRIDANTGGQYHISHKDMADAGPRQGAAGRCHSSGPVASCTAAHCRCCPPSSAIIWPVIAGRPRIITAARPTSVALVPWPSGTDADCRANWASVCLGLGRAGPGPIALTLMLGASANAMVWVNAHRPAFDTVYDTKCGVSDQTR